MFSGLWWHSKTRYSKHFRTWQQWSQPTVC